MGNERSCEVCGQECIAYIGDGDESAVIDDWTYWMPWCTPCVQEARLVVNAFTDQVERLLPKDAPPEMCGTIRQQVREAMCAPLKQADQQKE